MARALVSAAVALLPLLASAQTAGVTLSDDCRMEDSERLDSWDQVFALTPSECEHRGFCWARHDVPGVPWCFWKKGEGVVDAQECAAAADARRECAEKGAPTNEKTCAARACCWAAGAQGQPWCFHPGAPGSTPKPREKKPAAAAANEPPPLPPATPPAHSPRIRPTPPPPGWRPDVHPDARSEL